MWVIVTVVEEGAVVLTQQLSHFNELGAFPGSTVPVNPFNQLRISTEQMQVSLEFSLVVWSVITFVFNRTVLQQTAIRTCASRELIILHY